MNNIEMKVNSCIKKYENKYISILDKICYYNKQGFTDDEIIKKRMWNEFTSDIMLECYYKCKKK